MEVKELLKNDSDKKTLQAIRIKPDTMKKIDVICEKMAKITGKTYTKSKLMRKLIEDGVEHTYQQLVLMDLKLDT